ncbi:MULTISPECIES: hypothetical protein [unclassified Bacillus (in: firmicutes)]|uniref:hypothetical protein n=1 Tax=unclassified Bacillus (in: firmicutes) TaxID=185979 RepID=UPI0008E67CB3|nr:MULTISPECIES: hypothetical protein [unclassified Bacillus (in: firmicutes)]SFK13924.1 hypothetical protein SAMN04488574_1634 [Bacillus sp. 71mf]SFS96859.1 hypothetical protein SAMN04488145_1068 [Bacillus sp. 103mf]
MKGNKKQEVQYIREYTLRNNSIKSIKVESWRTMEDEMRVLGLKESDIFQIQLIRKKSN